jgi:hypothetical protein
VIADQMGRVLGTASYLSSITALFDFGAGRRSISDIDLKFKSQMLLGNLRYDVRPEEAREEHRGREGRRKSEAQALRHTHGTTAIC